MSSQEMLDIFNEAMERTGTAARGEVHLRGLWHQTFQCWVVSGSEKEGRMLLFQLRHPDKDTYPGLLDISCAGHLLAGESPEDGLRELEEELGIRAGLEELAPCGIFREEAFPSPDCIDREFCHVFLLEHQAPLRDYSFQESEVTGLFRLRPEHFEQLLSGRRSSVEADGILLLENGEKAEVRRTIRLTDIVPHSPEYYRFLLDHLYRWEAERGKEA